MQNSTLLVCKKQLAAPPNEHQVIKIFVKATIEKIEKVVQCILKNQQSKCKCNLHEVSL